MAGAMNNYSNDDTVCHLLDVPPEIRNTIYDLVFAPEVSESVELTEAKAPPKSLLLACQQILDETKYVYRAAYRKFWRETEFLITFERFLNNDGDDIFTRVVDKISAEHFNNMCENIKQLDDRDVSKINRLQILSGEATWHLEGKVWVETDNDPTSLRMWIMAPDHYVEAATHVGLEWPWEVYSEQSLYWSGFKYDPDNATDVERMQQAREFGADREIVKAHAKDHKGLAISDISLPYEEDELEHLMVEYNEIERSTRCPPLPY